MKLSRRSLKIQLYKLARYKLRIQKVLDMHKEIELSGRYMYKYDSFTAAFIERRSFWGCIQTGIRNLF